MNWIYPLRHLLPLVLILLSLPLTGVYYLIAMLHAEGAIEDQLQQRAAHSGNQLSLMLREAVLRDDDELTSRLINTTVTMPDLRYTLLLDERDNVLLSSDTRLFHRSLNDIPSSPMATMLAEARQTLASQTHYDKSHNTLWAMFPVRLELDKGELRSARVGMLVLAYDTERQLRTARHEELDHVIMGLVSTLLLAGLFWLYLHYALVRRIEHLGNALQHWHETGEDIPYIKGRDEISQITGQFTRLTRELAEQNRQLHAFFEHSFQFMGLLSPDGTLLEVNNLALDFCGASSEEVIGKTFWSTPWWSHDSSVQAQLRQDISAAAHGMHILRDVIHITPTGHTHYITFSLRPIQNDHGKVQWLLAEGHDITALKLAEQQSRQITAFYATLSQTNSAIVHSNSFDELLPQICRIAVEHGGLKGAWIGMRNNEGQITPSASFGMEDDYLQNLRISLDPHAPHGQGPTAHAMREGRHYICNDFLNDPHTVAWHERARASQISASAAFPLYRHNEVVGALNLYASEVGLFTPELIALLDEMASDISFALERFEREEQVRLAATVFDHSRESIIVTDVDANIISVNRSFTDITGYSAEEVIGQNPRLLNAGRQDTSFYDSMWATISATGYWQGELWNRRKNGEIYPALATITAVRDERGQLTKYIGITTDISEYKQAEERIRYLAYFDPLTELPNRSLVRDRTEQALRSAERNQTNAGLLFVDLDHFKHINDSLGHLAGDQLLQEVARRLRATLRQTDTVGRLGGDEFLILLPNTEPRHVAHVVQSLLSQIAAPYLIQGHTLTVTASIGIALYPRDGVDFDELHKCADTAMYKAKELGRNSYQFFTQELNNAALERLVLENALRNALQSNEFTLHYQPQVDVISGTIIGVEALLRWHHPELGQVSPAKFIPIAEETGLIDNIGAWVMREACRQNKAWQRDGLPPLIMAVNASTRQFSLGSVDEMVKHALAESALEPELLEIEITESLLAQDLDTTLEVLRDLKALGVRIAVDDFGTGYSSLAYLKRFPLDKLKIDQSFVRDLDSDADDRAIATAVTNLGHTLGLSVIAEGVETESQYKLLQWLGCDEVQGYHFSRPLPAAELAELLRSGKRWVLAP